MNPSSGTCAGIATGGGLAGSGSYREPLIGDLCRDRYGRWTGWFRSALLRLGRVLEHSDLADWLAPEPGEVVVGALPVLVRRRMRSRAPPTHPE